MTVHKVLTGRLGGAKPPPQPPRYKKTNCHPERSEGSHTNAVLGGEEKNLGF